MPRLFVAIALPDQAAGCLQPICQGLPGARWVGEDGFHLTVAFIGDVERPTAEAAERALGLVSAASFDLSLSGLGVFPLRGPPKVLWAGVAPCPELLALRRAVRSRLDRSGVPVDRRRFSPHVTLGRLRQTPADVLERHLHAWGGLAGPRWPVRHFELFESVLGHGGAVHRAQAAYMLNGSPPDGSA